jgi:hypothetical protein
VRGEAAGRDFRGRTDGQAAGATADGRADGCCWLDSAGGRATGGRGVVREGGRRVREMADRWREGGQPAASGQLAASGVADDRIDVISLAARGQARGVPLGKKGFE